jgi:GT2 family glycosyltransferase
MEMLDQIESSEHSQMRVSEQSQMRGAIPFDLSIITVSWNVRDLLRDCIRSVDASRGQLHLEMIVVDSASDDGSPDMIRQEFPWVELVVSEENLGFPGGNNVGIAHAKGRNILLLNPDTIILDDALQVMVHYIDRHVDVGALGAQILNPDLSIQSSRRRFPTMLTAIFESTWLENIAPAYILRNYYMLDLPDDEIADVDWVTGACLIVARRVIDQVGPLDEKYFMYSEELDWCRRIKDAGWRVLYLPQAQIIHHIGKSSEQAVTERHINFQRAKLRYIRKYHGRWAATLLRTLLLLIYSWQIAMEALKGLLGHRRSLRRQRIRSYWRVLRSGLKPAGY